MTSTVLVLSGPNLGLLGAREPEIYGATTLADIEADLHSLATELGLELQAVQSDDESVLVGWVHRAAEQGWDVVLNPAAFTHYSYALRDACAHLTASGSRLVEIHLSNPAARESFRHVSVIAGVATGTIAGFGPQSYRLGLQALAD